MGETLARPTIDEIRKVKQYLVEDLYINLRSRQAEDDKYYNDDFSVGIDQPYHVKRTGTAARIVDSVSDHICSSNITVLREPNKKTDKARESCYRVSKLLNNWVDILKDPIEDGIKNAPRRGEGYFQIDFNPDTEYFKQSCPLTIVAPDPMIVYADPVENFGIPQQVIKFHTVTPQSIKLLYPDWKGSYDSKDQLEYLAYWNKDWRYVEVNKEILVNVQPNVFGFVPFVHFYSGYGKTSYDAKPEDKAVGRLSRQGVRSRLVEECEIESRIDSIIGLWANPFVMFERTVEGIEIDEEEVRKIPVVPGYNVILPFGVKATLTQGAAPSAETFHHLNKIQAALGLEVPPVASGQASSSRSSGRLEDILGYQFARKHVKLTHNIERALEVTLAMCLRTVEKISGMLPLTVETEKIENGRKVSKEEEVTKEDIDNYYTCKVELKADKDIEDDRNIMLGQKLVDGGRISWRTFLIKYMGYTEDESDDEINESLCEKIMLTNPAIADVVARESLERQGLQRLIKELDAQAQAQGQTRALMSRGPIMEGKQVRPGEARDSTSREVVRQQLNETPVGVREPPREY